MSLDNYTSVFQAEMMAIIGAAGALMDHLPERKANIFIDCMSAFKALVSAVPLAGLTRDCWHLLKKLAGSRQVTQQFNEEMLLQFWAHYQQEKNWKKFTIYNNTLYSFWFFL